jgi:predicted PurR-regulated permease PerM
MWATLVLVFVALSFWLLFLFNQVVFILFVAIVIGTVTRPIVNWLYRRGLPRIGGVILVYFLLLALLIGFVLLLFPLIFKQGATIVTAVPGYYLSLRDWMGNNPNQLILRLSEFLPMTLPSLAPVQQTGPQMLASAG